MASSVNDVSIAGLIATAFAFVAALAWNDAIQKSITAAVGEKGSGVGASLLYAGLVTLIAIAMVFFIKKIQSATSKWRKKLPWLREQEKQALADDGNK